MPAFDRDRPFPTAAGSGSPTGITKTVCGSGVSSEALARAELDRARTGRPALDRADADPATTVSAVADAAAAETAATVSTAADAAAADAAAATTASAVAGAADADADADLATAGPALADVPIADRLRPDADGPGAGGTGSARVACCFGGFMDERGTDVARFRVGAGTAVPDAFESGRPLTAASGRAGDFRAARPVPPATGSAWSGCAILSPGFLRPDAVPDSGKVPGSTDFVAAVLRRRFAGSAAATG
ncbi:hypothetical protein Ais01nite_83900 [Asanoa ishikariensis]|nr:hypothetical protein Ais01nite_83900 [Asanoa ishikariensis]